MTAKQPAPRISSTRAPSRRSVAASLTGQPVEADQLKRRATPVADAPEDQVSIDTAALQSAFTQLRGTKPEPVKPRQFRIQVRLIEKMEDACEQLGCTNSAFANTAFETLLTALRENGEIK
jgi:hypothetical protein